MNINREKPTSLIGLHLLNSIICVFPLASVWIVFICVFICVRNYSPLSDKRETFTNAEKKKVSADEECSLLWNRFRKYTVFIWLIRFLFRLLQLHCDYWKLNVYWENIFLLIWFFFFWEMNNDSHNKY